jgi:twitching motility protein PilT
MTSAENRGDHFLGEPPVPLVDSLLSAIVKADGDALVLHAGERPYVVAPSGQSDLASRELTLEAMKGMVNELLPVEARKALDDDGAVQHQLTSSAGGEEFTVVAAKGGDDIWIEIRRRRQNVGAVEVQQPIEAVAPPEPPSPPPSPSPSHSPEPVAESPAVVLESPTEATTDEVMEIYNNLESPDVPETAPEIYELSDGLEPEVESNSQDTVEPVYTLSDDTSLNLEVVEYGESHEEPAAAVMLHPEPPLLEPEIEEPVVPAMPHRPTPQVVRAMEPESQSAVILPLSRPGARNDQAFRFAQPLQSTGIDRLLRIAAARGASTLYLTSQAVPSIRVDGEISTIEGEPLLSEQEIEAMMLDMIPERNRETLRSQAEWICDVPEVGRVRCVTFRDHRGAGGIFRMVPARAISADQLGLSREIQSLCAEAEGLVLITGPRASGKSTLISAFVDLINRTRSDHVITLENQINFVHENRLSLVSQRELRGDDAELMNAARTAVRENPDVLVIEDLRSPEIVTLALDAAHSGRLVIGALTAHTAADAIERIFEQTPPERRPKMQIGLAEALRGVVAQVLLRKTGGGRVAAREVLLNTTAVAKLIAEGKTSQIKTAIEGGRKHGMVPLNDALSFFVQSGVVDSREAYRQATDRSGLLALLQRHGIDTGFVERLA